jgi:hypothetical protein
MILGAGIIHALVYSCLLVAYAEPTSHGFLQPQVQAELGVDQQITVRIRNGNTGLPIWIASPYVFLGRADPQDFEKSYRRTKFWSDARVDVSGLTPREVRVWVDFIHRDCRFPAGDNRFSFFDFAGNTLKGIGFYDLDMILSKGVVATNLCSAKTQKPEPGVLTIYVIPATFKEIWNY